MNNNLLSTSTLSGTGITNRKGENLGDVKDVMIDIESGEVAYVVISFGGFLGIGDKLFAVPWEALQVDQVNEQIIIDVDKQKLENAPGFDKDNWPSSPDRQFIEDVHSHYGYKPYWERERTRSFETIGSSTREESFGTTGSRTTGLGDSGIGNAEGSDFRSGNSGLGNSGDRFSTDEGRIGGSRMRESGFGDRSSSADPDDSGLNTGKL